ncbi:hypothetical protein [Streptomyces albidochromogenes]|uniref:Uncharacterized protein n=1 Tax=Streptomyces albidochromogenes TaxID=329524 RepID=A0ABW6FLT3_9ACTN
MYRMAGERVRWLAVVDQARQIMESHEGGVTLRQVMYRLVSDKALPHTAPMYRACPRSWPRPAGRAGSST